MCSEQERPPSIETREAGTQKSASAWLRGLAFSYWGKGREKSLTCVLRKGSRTRSGEGQGLHSGPSDYLALSRWRARQLVKNIPPSDMAQIKAKVAAMAALQELRQDWGCRRAWARDYLSSVSAGLQGLAARKGLQAETLPVSTLAVLSLGLAVLWAVPLCPCPLPPQFKGFHSEPADVGFTESLLYPTPTPFPPFSTPPVSGTDPLVRHSPLTRTEHCGSRWPTWAL